MKYHVKFSCGHEGDVSLWVETELVEAKLRYYRTKGICPRCKELTTEEGRNKAEEKNIKKQEG